MTCTRNAARRILRACAATIFLIAAFPPAQAAEPLPANSLGVDLDVGAGTVPAWTAAPARDPNVPPLVVRLKVAWSALEPEPGVYRWDALDAQVEAAATAGYEIVIDVFGGHPGYLGPRSSLTPADTGALEAWTACLRALASRYAGRVRFYQVGRRPDARESVSPEEAAKDYAYVFKRSAVALRSADPNARVALGSIGADSATFASVVYQEEVAPYADALSVAYGDSPPAQAALAQMRGLLLANDPSAKLWITGARALLGMEGYGQILRAYVQAMQSEAELITFEDPGGQSGVPFHLAAMERARALFTPSYAALVESGPGVRVVSSSGKKVEKALAARFFSADDKQVLMAYDGGPSPRQGDYAVFILDSVDVAAPALHDLAAGEESNQVTLQKDPNAGVTRLALPLAGYPLVLSYKRFTSPEYAKEGEKLNVTGERIPSADEIIARYQAVQAAQDALLKSLSADAEETWHFSVTTGGSFDVTFLESFFLDPNVGAEWEQRELLVNGVRWKTNRIPELPFVLPEKAASLPLNITLSKQYVYTYRSREEVDGHDCYLISFEPIDKTTNLSSGKVWIDSESYARVRLSQVQDHQPAPIVSNDQRDTYKPVTGPDGFTYWVLSQINAEQIYSTSGRTFTINKKVHLHDFVINGPDFAEKREAALTSPHTMLRDTDKGLRYLRPAHGGEREVQTSVNHLNLFAVGGVYYNKSLSGPVPLAGINYYDSNFLGKGLQSNLFFAGALLFGNLSDPSLFGTHMDASLDLIGVAFPSTDRLARQNRSTGDVSVRDGEEITEKTQSLTGGVGLPVGAFFKVRAEGEIAYTDYGRTRDTCSSMVSPRDTYVRTATLMGEFNRRAWSASFRHSWSDRTQNSPWGLEPGNDPACPSLSPAVPPDFSESAKNYVQYEGAVTKEFYLAHHQKLHFGVSAAGSRDVDRFSKFKFGFFSNRMRGFSGAGIHYTDGTIYHAAYSFNLGEAVRFDAFVDHARVRDRQLQEDYRNYTGTGLAAQLAGPWNLFFRLEWGIAVASDVKAFEGEQEVLFTVLKLFSQR